MFFLSHPNRWVKQSTDFPGGHTTNCSPWLLLNQGKAWISLSGFLFLLLGAIIHFVEAWTWMQQRNPTEFHGWMEMDACFTANWICNDFRRKNLLSSPEEQDLDVTLRNFSSKHTYLYLLVKSACRATCQREQTASSQMWLMEHPLLISI